MASRVVAVAAVACGECSLGGLGRAPLLRTSWWRRSGLASHCGSEATLHPAVQLRAAAPAGLLEASKKKSEAAHALTATDEDAEANRLKARTITSTGVQPLMLMSFLDCNWKGCKLMAACS